MARDEPRDEPDGNEVHAAAATALDREVTDVTPIARGVNALYRLGLADGSRAVLKVPLYATEPAFLAEPALLARIRRETDVPVPRVLARSAHGDGPLGAPFYAMTHVDGRTVDATFELAPAARERLVREAANHLAAIHDLSVAAPFGRLHLVDGDLGAEQPRDTWWALFYDLADDVTTAMRGDGPLTDDEPRFEDLASRIGAALTEGGTVAADGPASPAFVVRDYRPSNVLLAPDDGEPLVRGVLDVSCLAGDPLLDVARTEDALVDVPLGGTAEANSLREAFRAAYAADRGADRAALFDARYPYYRLYARAYRLKAFDYAAQFAREDDPDAVARRWRSFVDARLAEIRDGR